MGYIVLTHTEAGAVKRADQDSYCFQVAETPYGHVAIAAVCDGVGGLHNGELASSTMIKLLLDWFKQELPCMLPGLMSGGKLDGQALGVEIGMQLVRANDCVFGYGRSTDEPLGTTCTCMVSVGSSYAIAHVGDTRFYEIAGRNARVVTSDQTYVASEVRAGRMTESEARRHPQRNIILQAVGSQRDLDPEIVVGTLRGDATYLLCSDGFRNMLEPDEIVQAFDRNELAQAQDLQDIVANLCELIKERGEKDNITAVAFMLDGSADNELLASADIAGAQITASVSDASSEEDEDLAVTHVGVDSEDESIPVVGEDSLATQVGSYDEDEVATQVGGTDEDACRTIVGEDATPTVVEQAADQVRREGGER